MAEPRFILTRSADDQFHFSLTAGNGEKILSSETYTAKASAKTGIESTRQNAPFDESYQRLIARDGSPYFVLRAGNAQILGTSEMYSSNQARDGGIASVQQNAPIAVVEDRA